MQFDCFKNKKIFVTGGTGFFGKSILDMLSRGFLSDTHFTMLSRHPERFILDYPEFAKLGNVDFVSGDIRDFEFPQGDFDYLIHAATPAVTGLAPGEMSSIIIGGMHRVLDFSRKCGIKRLLFTSSGAVYGMQEPDCTNISEQHECRPLTEYGIAKLEAEKMCEFSQVECVIARCFAFVGPHLNKNIHFAIGNFIRDAASKDEIVIKGDGTPYRSYMYADDLVMWLFAILERGKPFYPYNVGSPEGMPLAEVASAVADVFPHAPQVKILTPALAGVPPSRYVPDISRAESELGLSIKTSLAEAIKKSI